ncbi:MAG: LysM peptidoglycan-binding domain-containing protein [Phycisphaerales bacterium]|nr:LysM peptidoglycan-binding domain-containing protein [Phycisphaerales bacterium]
MNPRLRNPGVGLLALGLLWVTLYWAASPNASRSPIDEFDDHGPVLVRQTDRERAQEQSRERPERPREHHQAERSPAAPPPVGHQPGDAGSEAAAEVAEPDPPEPAERTYTVRSGDSLSVISQRVYGSARHWRVLYEANRDRIPDPDRLRVGAELRVPPLPDGR